MVGGQESVRAALCWGQRGRGGMGSVLVFVADRQFLLSLGSGRGVRQLWGGGACAERSIRWCSAFAGAGMSVTLSGEDCVRFCG